MLDIYDEKAIAARTNESALNELVRENNSFIGKIVSAVGTIMTIVPKVAGAIQTIKGGLAGLHAVMAANPIGIVIAAIAALVAAFIYLWNNCEEFREFWINLWEKVKDVAVKVWNGIKTFVTNAWNAIKATAETVFNAISTFFSGIWQGMPDFIGGLAQGIERSRGMIQNAMKGLAGDMVLTPALAGAGAGGAVANTGAADLIAAMRESLSNANSQAAGDITIPVYIGNERIEEIVVKANKAASYHSGGR